MLTLSHTHSILSLVHAGWGVALVPRSAMRLGFGNVVFRALREPEGLHAELQLVWRRESRHAVAGKVRGVLMAAFS